MEQKPFYDNDCIGDLTTLPPVESNATTLPTETKGSKNPLK